MSWILDLIIVTILLITVLLSAKKGFVCTLIEVAGGIAALLIALAVSTPLASLTYDRVIEPPLIKTAQETVSTTGEQRADAVWSSLPKFVTDNAGSIGLSKEKFVSTLTPNAESTEAAAKNLSATVVKPVVTKLFGTLYTAVLLILLLIAVRFLAKWINKLFSFSVVGKLNRGLGGVIGIVKGAILALLFCQIILLIVAFTTDGFWIFNYDNIEKSHLFRLLAQCSPFFAIK